MCTQIQLLSKQPNVTQNDINSAVMRLLWCGVPQRQDTHRLFTAYNTQLFMSRVYVSTHLHARKQAHFALHKPYTGLLDTQTTALVPH